MYDHVFIHLSEYALTACLVSYYYNLHKFLFYFYIYATDSNCFVYITDTSP